MSRWVEIPELLIWGMPVALDFSHYRGDDAEALAGVISGAMKDYLEKVRKTEHERGEFFIENIGLLSDRRVRA